MKKIKKYWYKNQEVVLVNPDDLNLLDEESKTLLEKYYVDEDFVSTAYTAAEEVILCLTKNDIDTHFVWTDEGEEDEDIEDMYKYQLYTNHFNTYRNDCFSFGFYRDYDGAVLTTEQQEVIANIIDQYVEWEKRPKTEDDWWKRANGYDLVISPNKEPFAKPGEDSIDTVKRIWKETQMYLRGLDYEPDISDYDDLTMCGELRWTSDIIPDDVRIIQDAWYTWEDDDEINLPTASEQEAINYIKEMYNELKEEADGEEFCIDEDEFIDVFDAMDLTRHKNIVTSVLNNRFPDIRDVLICQYYRYGRFGDIEVNAEIRGQIGYKLCVENGLEEGFYTESEYLYNN